MLYKVFLILSCILFDVISCETSFETFLKTNPTVDDKIKVSHVNFTEVKSIFKKCGKTGNENFVDDTLFTIENSNICNGRVSILVAIHSNNPNSVRRQIIRETYGSIRRIGSFTVRLAFFVGQSADRIDQTELEKENEINGDIVQRDFLESYRNMTRKHLTVLEWATKHCNDAQYLLKTDDDVFIDLYHAVREIKSGRAEAGFLCSSTKNSRPERSQKGSLKKWFVTEAEYSAKEYPTYCEGYGYIVPMAFVPSLFLCSVFHNYFWIDDVHVGGVLPQLLSIERHNFAGGGGAFFMLPSHASHKVLDGVFFVAYYSEFVHHQWRKMWRAVIDYSMNI